MILGPLVNLASGFIESLIPGSSNSSSSTSTSATSTTAGAQGASQAQPFAQVLSSLQQSAAVEFQTVTQQFASYLQTGAQSATASGNAALASQLTQISKDLADASASGRLPNL